MVVIGLGNPGPAYAGTRHNIGFMVADSLALRLGISFRKPLFRPFLYAHGAWNGEGPSAAIHLVKPLTFMNRSGRAVRGALRKAGGKPEAMVVVCDTLDLPAGAVRLKRGGSSAGHRGLSSIIEHLGSEHFLRLYVGTGRPEEKSEVVDFVLSPFNADESHLIDEAVSRACSALLSLTERRPEEIMNELNRKRDGTDFGR
jgi:peptidyl-tRNA hydrolase, PTH1 family